MPSRTNSSPRAERIALASIIAAVTMARGVLVRTGPDADADSIGHALIGRLMRERPWDVRIHWVWLPLWHAIDALTNALDRTRILNVALSALAPVLLYATLHTHLTAHPAPPDSWLARAERAIPFVAAALLALSPLCLVMGESAQPEPLFQCLVLGACAAWHRRGAVVTSVLLSAAVMLRYEAWSLVPAFAWLAWRRRPRRVMDAMTFVLPGAVIIAWLAARWAQTGNALGFLAENRAFVAHAAAGIGHARSPFRYIIGIPSHDFGVLMLFAPIGAWWIARRAPRSFRPVPLALMALLTATWIKGTQLGLDRHFTALVPFYATAIAAGACGCVAWFAARASEHRQRLAMLGVVVAIVAGFTLGGTAPAFVRTRAVLRDSFASARRAGDVLRVRGGSRGTVFCDDAAVELFSTLPADRFVRWNGANVNTFHLAHEAHAQGQAFVVSAPSRVTSLRASTTTLYEDSARVVLRFQ